MSLLANAAIFGPPEGRTGASCSGCFLIWADKRRSTGMKTRPSPCGRISRSAKRRMPAVATPKGGRRWCKVEDAVVRKTYPNYGLMRLCLPCRSVAALKRRAAILGVVKCRHVWTQTEVRRLSRLVEANTSNADLALAFPHLRLAQITAKIRHLGLPRRRPQLVDFADAAIGKSPSTCCREGFVSTGFGQAGADETLFSTKHPSTES